MQDKNKNLKQPELVKQKPDKTNVILFSILGAELLLIISLIIAIVLTRQQPLPSIEYSEVTDYSGQIEPQKQDLNNNQLPDETLKPDCQESSIAVKTINATNSSADGEMMVQESTGAYYCNEEYGFKVKLPDDITKVYYLKHQGYVSSYIIIIDMEKDGVLLNKTIVNGTIDLMEDYLTGQLTITSQELADFIIEHTPYTVLIKDKINSNPQQYDVYYVILYNPVFVLD